MSEAAVPFDRVRIVCATRRTRAEFFSDSPLARSLAAHRGGDFEWLVFEQNSRGLAEVYNEAIRQSVLDPGVLVFVHDDVWICDFFWVDRLLDALGEFDVVGIAGNRRRLPRQPAWAFVESMEWDAPQYLSGVVGWGSGFPPDGISLFGRPGAEVCLLDGLFLAIRSDLLHRHQLSFDEQFKFHFYDMDFCRQCEQKGLRMGTWPISVIHQSGGSFGSLAWQAARVRYLQKWTS